MSAIASSQPSLLATLSPEQVATFLQARGLEVYANSGIAMDGATLSVLTTSMLVKKSVYNKVGDGLSRSLLAKEIRNALTPTGETKLKAMFFKDTEEQQPGFVLKPPGDIYNPDWRTITDAICSDDGVSGVIFVNTETGGYVIKASDTPVREACGSRLAEFLKIPTAKCRVVPNSERIKIIRGLSTICGSVDHSVAFDCSTDAMKAVQMKLWTTFKREFMTLIELVPSAELLFGMPPERAQSQLTAETEGGRKRLTQLGELIAFDAFLNNGDRVPVVHSNIGNARNVMFSNGDQGDIIAIDQVITCFRTIEGKDSMKENSPTMLYNEYIERVRTWLNHCFQYESLENHGDFDRSFSHDDLGEGPLKLSTDLKMAYGLDDTLAEAIVRLVPSSFDDCYAHMAAQNPTLLAYAKARGSQGVIPGSLLGVRDFIVTQCMYDIKEEGCNRIRSGVMSMSKKIAAMKIEDVQSVLKDVEGMVQCSGTGDDDGSEAMWKFKLNEVVNIDYFERMLGVFRDSVAAVHC
jgi:hypothetical protein|eukprot:Stramenopile-MAST_4_protein_1394